MAELAWQNGGWETPEGTVMTLWIAGPREEVLHWWVTKEIPLSEGGAGKGQYVGFRDHPRRALERMMLVRQPHSIKKANILMMEIRLSPEAFIEMVREKVLDHCWGTRLHYVVYTNSPTEWGVWYYHGQPFSLNACGVYVFPPQEIG